MSRTTRSSQSAGLPFDRRTVLKLGGVALALPLLSTVLPASARAQTAPNSTGRSRFIGVFFPNGALMPSAE